MYHFKMYSRKLLLWSFYVLSCAMPAFGIAYSYGFNTWQAIIGMVLGATTCIFVFATMEALFLDADRHLRFYRVLHWTLRLRALVAIAAQLPALSFLMLPDLLAGMLAMQATERLQARGWLAFSESSADMNSILVPYLMTLIGGFCALLGILLMMPLMHAFITTYLKPVTTVAGPRTY